MSDIVITVNRNLHAQLTKVYADFGAYTKQMSIDLVKEEGALTCRAAIDFSPPLNGKLGGKGDKKIAQHWGDWAVANDVLTVVGEDSKTLASAMGSKKNSLAKFTKWRMGKPPKTQGLASKIWQDTNPERAFKRAQNLFGRFGGRRIGIIENDSALKARHDRIRKMYKGRIRKNGGRDPITGQVKGEQPHFASIQIIERYIKTRQLRVGFMKAGWISAINKIGTPKINGVEKKFGLRKMPTWVSRHPAGHGSAGLNIFNGAANDVHLVVRNDLGNIFGVGYLAGTRRFVIGVRAGKMSARMRHFMRIAIEKANTGRSPT